MLSGPRPPGKRAGGLLAGGGPPPVAHLTFEAFCNTHQTALMRDRLGHVSKPRPLLRLLAAKRDSDAMSYGHIGLRQRC
ncbi:MAG: hypothetical protein B7Y80_08845 [Hyphomicrobium sp. 32-62-53]|nr:MAG: hypothetical protein B7Z29_09775 [Hyphomicrobium sp. 12-62-95]OYY00011.1 MAG: hypothetical protein B7Y80_08845 [Hyphomicrobium sp. 32-62-53]